jgi:hypothetical protein
MIYHSNFDITGFLLFVYIYIDNPDEILMRNRRHSHENGGKPLRGFLPFGQVSSNLGITPYKYKPAQGSPRLIYKL